MIETVIQWHKISEGDMPENYSLDYSYKCHEYSKQVWIVLEDGYIIKGIRCRLTTENDFKWYPKKNSRTVLEFSHSPIGWAFIPSTKELKNLFNKESK